jgi:UDP-N-acetylglucosamine--N-acetylmuramyl-(pentapeptide) pyrophosphoryl-undecaprenol N-acetylglucosamine transferase
MTALLFAGGGTGGHVFPMIAVADAVRALAPEVRLTFVGTERGLEVTALPARGYSLETLRIAPLRGGGIRGALRGAALAARAVPEARRLIRRHAPLAVLSVGGYAAGPVALAARSLGIPVALVEPNGAIGLANRFVSPFVQRAYTAFPEAARHFTTKIVLETGVPLRAGFAPQPFRPGRLLSVLVLGGSQGAQSLNRAVPRALSSSALDVTVVHQCGAGKDAEVRALYAELGAAARVTVVPFIDDMPSALAAADLVIGRAGASAIAEICAVGRPSILIPYPFAGDHQRHNSESLERRGAAISLRASEATPERLEAEITRLDRDRSALARIADAARSLGRPFAATMIAEDLLGLARLSHRAGGVASANARASGDDGKSSRSEQVCSEAGAAGAARYQGAWRQLTETHVARVVMHFCERNFLLGTPRIQRRRNGSAGLPGARAEREARAPLSPQPMGGRA